MTDYLRWITTLVAQVIVVDGSPQPIFDRHHDAWSRIVTHVAPDPDLEFVFGKVNGVHTGLRRSRCERVVLADDDVRYDENSLRQVVGLLDAADLVRPQNYFSPTPWHAYWDSARTSLNRVSGGDFPGTLAVRRSAFWHIGGYDGDVLFENLELERTIESGGGRVLVALDCYVRRLPPTASHFRSQRVRQAYDEFARPTRLIGALAIAPGLFALACGAASSRSPSPRPAWSPPPRWADGGKAERGCSRRSRRSWRRHGSSNGLSARGSPLGRRCIAAASSTATW